MCGIVGAIATRPIVDILLAGLHRLEYRGYDSAGIAVVNEQGLQRLRRVGKVSALAAAQQITRLNGRIGIGHTRWATHGKVTEKNAHPHVSSTRLAVVHNGIIENHQTLREQLQQRGYVFTSETDTEVICHLVHYHLEITSSLLTAVQAAVQQLQGAYGMVVMDQYEPERLIAARSGSPLVVGLGKDENFIASDPFALLPVTHTFIYLEEGDVAAISRTQVQIYNAEGACVSRELTYSKAEDETCGKGEFSHFMLKEIYEQPTALRNVVKGRIQGEKLAADAFGVAAKDIFNSIEHVQIVACGTSYHAGLVARYWLEEYAGLSCHVEIASEFRYRKSVVPPASLLVTLSQSGETADTLAALRLAKTLNYAATLTICNVATSSLVRESDLAFLTQAGTEIGVASTKAFTTQLASLLMLVAALSGSTEVESRIVQALLALPQAVSDALFIAPEIEALAEEFNDKDHALFLGRGVHYPIAMEGALKLKEVSYIHAEAYAAGELKHGPLALIDANMPVIVIAPENELLDKLKSNIAEVRARGSLMYIFTEQGTGFKPDSSMHRVHLPRVDAFTAPILYSLPLQLLSYYIAKIKGTDIDQPRNLAKSVTVE